MTRAPTCTFSYAATFFHPRSSCIYHLTSSLMYNIQFNTLTVIATPICLSHGIHCLDLTREEGRAGLKVRMSAEGETL